jgi:hypothetical protein
MKQLVLFLLVMPTIALTLGTEALAQNVGDNSVYFVTYFSNGNTAGAPDEVVRIVNDGDQATTAVEGMENGPLWASLYVLDDSEEMAECCSCVVTADGLLSESVNKQLTASTFSARTETSRGVIKIISSSVQAGGPTNFTNALAPGLRVWATHIQRLASQTGGFYVSETQVADSNLVSTEKNDMETLCMWINALGSGWGTCNCTPEDYDF